MFPQQGKGRRMMDQKSSQEWEAATSRLTLREIRQTCSAHRKTTELTIIIPITCSTTAGSVARYRSPTNEREILRLLLHLGRRCDGRGGRGSGLGALFVTLRHSRRFTSFPPCAQLIEAEGPRSEVGALVEAALIADDLAGVEGGAAPRGWLGGVAVEAAATEVLGLLAGGVVCVLDGDGPAGGRGEI